MKAMVYERYGAPADVLALREVDPPPVGDDEVRVRVRAAALNPGDAFLVRGAPWIVRMGAGLRRPKRGIPGFDLAGEVEAVGAKVTGLQPGDDVFGAGLGACAELACAKEEHLVERPAGLSFEQAAAVPTSGLAALHALRHTAHVEAGQRVLINGASGGIGTFAVQLAKVFGAEVTGVCSARNVDLVRSLGADRVLDYTRDDLTREPGGYDVILDNVENHPLADVRRVLAPDGTLILNSGRGASGLRFLSRMAKPVLLSPFVRQDLRRFFSAPNRTDLVELRALLEVGRLEPVIGETVPLSALPSALARMEGGHARGKIVVVL